MREWWFEWILYKSARNRIKVCKIVSKCLRSYESVRDHPNLFLIKKRWLKKVLWEWGFGIGLGSYKVIPDALVYYCCRMWFFIKFSLLFSVMVIYFFVSFLYLCHMCNFNKDFYYEEILLDWCENCIIKIRKFLLKKYNFCFFQRFRK